MKSPLWRCLAVVVLLELPAPAAEEVINLGTRRELFVDGFLVDRMQGLQFRLHPPCETGVALRFDQPWEGRTSAYVTVLKDGSKYRMYYRASGQKGTPKREFTCVAESSDGVHWTKPRLGLHAYGKHPRTNIILATSGAEGTHNFTPFVDRNPQASPQQRYKALGGVPPRAFVSADGIHWKLLHPRPVLTQGAFDSQNLAFWDPNRRCYVAYFRVFRRGVRAVATATSQDFIHWSKPQPVQMQQAPGEHFYTNAVQVYFRAPHIYLAFPKRYFPGRQKLPKHPYRGISDGAFLTSRDGVHFQRTFSQAFLRPGPDPRNWGDRSNMIAWGLVPTGRRKMSLYFSRHYRFDSAHIARAEYVVDRLASLHAGAQAGWVLTPPLRFAGGELRLNYSTSAFGSVKIEVLSAQGEPLPGFSGSEAPELFGDGVDQRYPMDFSPLVGKVVRLRIVLQDADLFSLRFVR